MPGGERGDGLGRGGRAPRQRERGSWPRLGLFGLCRFFSQTLAAGCPAASGAMVSAEAAGAAAARAGQATAARAFRTLSFFRPNPSRGVPGGERGDGLGRGGQVPWPRERGSRPRLGLFGLCRFFGQTLAAGWAEEKRLVSGQCVGRWTSSIFQAGRRRRAGTAEWRDVSGRCFGRWTSSIFQAGRRRRGEAAEWRAVSGRGFGRWT